MRSLQPTTAGRSQQRVTAVTTDARRRIEGGAPLLGMIGSLCWSFVGVVVVLALVAGALATVSEVVLPMGFALVLAVVFAPVCRRLRARGWPAGLAALAVVFALVVVSVGTVLLATVAIADQAGAWSDQVDASVSEVASTSEDVGLHASQVDDVRHAIGTSAALLAGGVLTLLVGGVGTVLGFLAGAVLAVLILYYLLKDTAAFRDWLVGRFSPGAQGEVAALVDRSAGAIRAYAAGRTVLSALVALVITVWSALLGLPLLGTIAVVNLLGGYVPYLGAVVGGAVAVVLALAETGYAGALATLVVVLAANFALENLIEPRVMGNRLDIHPLVVLVVTTAGGIVWGIAGLILAVPTFLVVVDCVKTTRRRLLEAP